MKIKLVDQDSASSYFKFKIGDQVQVKYSDIIGVIVDGDSYPEFGPNMTFYLIKAPNSMTYTYMENDLDPTPKFASETLAQPMVTADIEQD